MNKQLDMFLQAELAATLAEVKPSTWTPAKATTSVVGKGMANPTPNGVQGELFGKKPKGSSFTHI